MKITKGKHHQPQKILLYGVEGVGKTTLAAQFPKPLILDCEGGTAHLDIDRVRCFTWADMIEACLSLRDGKCDYATIVVDTADWAEQLCTEYTCQKEGWTSVETPGYGKGFNRVTEEMQRWLQGPLHDLQYKHAVNLVLVAHARVMRFVDPVLGAEYDRYVLKCRESGKVSTSAILREWADAVLFLNYHTAAKIETQKTGETTKSKAKTSARTGIRRMCYTQHTAAYDAKNRWGLPDSFSLEPDGDDSYGYAVLKPHVEVAFGGNYTKPEPVVEAPPSSTTTAPPPTDLEYAKKAQALCLTLASTCGGKDFVIGILAGRSLKTMTTEQVDDFVAEVREAVRVQKEKEQKTNE